MQNTIEPDDLDYEALGIPFVSNGPLVGTDPIGPAELEDENGWSKSETWVMQAESSGACGDYAIGPYYQGHYTCGPNAEGEFMVVEESYFVTAHWYEDHDAPEGEPKRRMNFDVTGMYSFTLCSDPRDPGGTELGTDTEYDDGIHSLFLWTYEEARALAERMARSDQRGTYTWRKS